MIIYQISTHVRFHLNMGKDGQESFLHSTKTKSHNIINFQL
jgi:hypothetical protein